MVTTAKKKGAPALKYASSDPDAMLAGGGLPTGFEGVVARARYTAWDYGGSEKFRRNREAKGLTPAILAVRLEIEPTSTTDDGAEVESPVIAFYAAGELDQFAPTDGDESAEEILERLEKLDIGDEGLDGLYAAQVGSKEDLGRNSNYGFLLRKTREAPGSDLTERTSPNVAEMWEGVHGRWDRIPQPVRGGLDHPAEGEAKRANDILVITKFTDAPKVASKSKSTSTSKGSAAAATSKAADNGLDEKIDEAMISVLSDADGAIPKTKLPGLISKALKGDKMQLKAVKRVSDPEYLNREEGWSFDADEGTVSLG
jgi:hypothetical protein